MTRSLSWQPFDVASVRSISSLAPVAIVVLLSLASAPAAAAPWDDAAKGVQDMLYGPLGTTLAVIGVAGAGLAAFFGRLSWERAGYVICGIVIFFSAPALVGYFKGKLGATVVSAPAAVQRA